MTIRNNITSAAFVAAIAVGFTGLASPTFADETIELNRYDLTRVEDADRLQLDIVQAASRECKASLATWVYQWRARHVKDCIEDAVDYTVAQVQNLGLSQLHASIDADQRYDRNRGPAPVDAE